jgi:hypothetical protein
VLFNDTLKTTEVALQILNWWLFQKGEGHSGTKKCMAFFPVKDKTDGQQNKSGGY